MRAATEGHLPRVMPQGNLVEVFGREVRKGLPGELMVESFPSCQRRPPCKTSKEMSDEAADAAALTYLLTEEHQRHLKSVHELLQRHQSIPASINQGSSSHASHFADTSSIKMEYTWTPQRSRSFEFALL